SPSTRQCRPRKPHTFPTRRSSDLGIMGKAFHVAALAFGKKSIESQGGFTASGNAGNDDQLVLGNAEVYVAEIVFPGPFDPDKGRSEEHTSELQSRENLVGRLLLEK